MASPRRSAAKTSTRRRRPLASTSTRAMHLVARRRRRRASRRRDPLADTGHGGTARASRRGSPAARRGASESRRVEEHAPRVASTACSVERRAGRMVHGPQSSAISGASASASRAAIAASQRARVRGRGVRPHAAAHGARRRRLGGELVEARERLGLAARRRTARCASEAVGSEDQSSRGVALEDAAAGAVGARGRRSARGARRIAGRGRRRCEWSTSSTSSSKAADVPAAAHRLRARTRSERCGDRRTRRPVRAPSPSGPRSVGPCSAATERAVAAARVRSGPSGSSSA